MSAWFSLHSIWRFSKVTRSASSMGSEHFFLKGDQGWTVFSEIKWSDPGSGIEWIEWTLVLEKAPVSGEVTAEFG